MKVKIREFKPEDYSECVKIWKETRLYIWYMDNKNDILKFHQNNPDLFLVAELNAKVIGTVMATYSGNFALVYHLAVKPEFQKRGIGRKILDKILKKLKGKGARFAFVINHSKHKDALPFYYKMGFRSVGKFTGLWKKL